MNKKPQMPSFGRARESGAAMVIALVMLLVLTLLATASARMTLMEERMTGNTQDRNIAFQAAEASLRAGEGLAQLPLLPVFDNNASGLYEATLPGADPRWSTVTWGLASSVLVYDELDDAPGALADASASYIVEQLPPVPEPGETLKIKEIEDGTYYRVTSRGVGVAGTATVTLQSTFKR